MADDNILRIGAEFDVAPIIAGAEAAGNAVEGLGAKIGTVAPYAESEEQALNAVEVASNRLQVRTASTAAQSNEEAAALARVGAAADALVPKMNNAAAATQHAGSVMGFARVEAGALDGSVGMMAGGLARVAAASSTLAPIITAAFPVFAAFAFVEILSRVADAFNKATDEVAGYTDALKKADKAQVEWSQKTEGNALTLQEFHKKLAANITEQATEGSKSYFTKYSEAFKKLQEQPHALGAVSSDPLVALKDATVALFTANADAANKAQHLNDVQEELRKSGDALTITNDRIKLSQLEVNEAVQKASVPGNRAEQLDAEINALKEKQRLEIDIANYEISQKFREGGGDVGAAKAEAAANIKAKYAADISKAEIERAQEVDRQERDLDQAKAERQKTITLAVVSYDEAATRESYEMHRITAEEETSQLLSEEDRRITAIRKFYDEQESITRAKGKETGADVRPELEKIGGDRAAAEEKHQQDSAAIRTKGTEEILRRDEERALHEIQLNEQVIESDDKLAEHRAEVSLRKADTPDEIKGAEAASIAATTKTINDQIAAIEKENVVLAKDPSEAAQAKIAENVAKIHELKNSATRNEEDSEREATERIEQYYSEQLSVARSTAQETVESFRDAEKNSIESARTSFEEREISGKHYIEEVKAIASQELTAEAAVYAQELQQVENLYNAELISYKEYQAQKAAIDKQIAEAERRAAEEGANAVQQVTKRQEQDIKRLADEWGNDWVKMANEVIQHRETIGVAVRNMMGQIELQMIDNGIKKIVTETAQWLLKDIENWIKAQAAKNAAQAAGDAAGQAIKKTSEEKSAIGDAKTAAKGAYAAVSSIPIIGPVLAPVAAAAAFAAVLAFEQGGIVPGDQAIYAHDQEMVLPAPISKGLQGAIPAISNFNSVIEKSGGDNIQSLVSNNSSSSQTTNQGPRYIRPTINFNGGSGGLTHEDIVKSVKQALRNGEIRL